MNQQNLKYPKVYAPMPLEQTIGKDSLGYSIKGLYAYLAAPCYLISERKSYRSDGTTKMDYEVVFCNKPKNTPQFELEEDVPHFNWDAECTNAITVTEIGIDYETMKKRCNEKSADLMISSNIHLPIKQLQTAYCNYAEELEQLYKTLEQNVQSNPVFTKTNK